jgi:hypothetical protein
MTDRRSFLAKLTGALAGLVASKHVEMAPAAVPKKLIVGVDLAKAGGDETVIATYDRNGLWVSRGDRTWIGGGFRDVTIDGHEATDVWAVTDYGYSHRLDGSFWGKIECLAPAYDAEDSFEHERTPLAPLYWQSWTYVGWVKVGHWPDFVTGKGSGVLG